MQPQRLGPVDFSDACFQLVLEEAVSSMCRGIVAEVLHDEYHMFQVQRRLDDLFELLLEDMIEEVAEEAQVEDVIRSIGAEVIAAVTEVQLAGIASESLDEARREDEEQRTQTDLADAFTGRALMRNLIHRCATQASSTLIREAVLRVLDKEMTSVLVQNAANISAPLEAIAQNPVQAGVHTALFNGVALPLMVTHLAGTLPVALEAGMKAELEWDLRDFISERDEAAKEGITNIPFS